ncbi:MAG: NAD+ synthase [Candidatus Latescibacteria bacterium]|jgi:NAD+ synthase (glutamine-hydrolysing)|nr:NAD+ synthase [Candidatus Latescibacterota bacterium]
MRHLRLTIAQVNTTVGDFDGNVDLCLAAVNKAEASGSDLIVFPELAITGYPPEDLLLKPGFLRQCEKALDRFTEGVGEICAVIGFVDGTGPVYNAAAAVFDNKIHCVYHKMCLPNYGVFDEKRYFRPGSDPKSFMLGDVTVGLNICEDTWVTDGPHCILSAEHGIDVLLNLSASPFHTGKLHERAEMLSKRSLNNKYAVVYVNLVGGQDELVFDGGSMVFDKSGKCIVKASSFVEQLVTLDMNFDRPSPDENLSCTRIPISNASKPPVEIPVAAEMSEEEEILESLVLGTGDYIRKNGFSKAVIGLSGGIDSSLVAAIAVRALGAEHVTGITMPSEYTSKGTRSDAEALAENLGIRFMEIPISRTFDAFRETLSEPFKDCEEDVTEENLQARIRGTLLMALSNKFGCLVLTSGNKSEMATGYATLYGDMAGGFAVIKDVPKLMVYRICRLINKQAGNEVIPETILTREPSAELRPDQKDSDSLPPYEILDPILRAYIEDDMGVENIVSLGFDRNTVKKAIRLCDNSEYKRRQAPPGIKITPRALGRDRRLPITNRFKQ